MSSEFIYTIIIDDAKAIKARIYREAWFPVFCVTPSFYVLFSEEKNMIKSTSIFLSLQHHVYV